MPSLHLASIDLPAIGRIGVAASARGLRALAFLADGDDLPVARWADDGWTPTGDRNALLARALAELADYAAGKRRAFTVDVDLPDRTPFLAAIRAACRRIPFGAVASYGELAEQAGHPGAARAVGQAMATNPLPIVVPCHRVIASGGRLGGFSPGCGLPASALKMRLLAHEGIAVRGGRVIAGPRTSAVSR